MTVSEPIFRSLDSSAMAHKIRAAQKSVCYAVSGIQQEPADAIAALARRIGPELITVCLAFDEHVMRMGFGELAAVKTLHKAGIVVRSGEMGEGHQKDQNEENGEEESSRRR